MKTVTKKISTAVMLVLMLISAQSCSSGNSSYSYQPSGYEETTYEDNTQYEEEQNTQPDIHDIVSTAAAQGIVYE